MLCLLTCHFIAAGGKPIGGTFFALFEIREASTVNARCHVVFGCMFAKSGISRIALLGACQDSSASTVVRARFLEYGAICENVQPCGSLSSIDDDGKVELCTQLVP